MNADKIKEIVDEKNKEAEYEMGRNARNLINEIARCEDQIRSLREQQTDCRNRLKALETTPLDPGLILG